MAADVAGARSRRNAPVLAAIAALAVFLPVAPARAASLQKVNTSEWSVAGLPSYVSMYIYVPDQRAAKPPIVVGPHHCQGNGPGTFNEMSSLVSIANRTGFIMIFPEATGQNCWDAGSTRSLKHDAGGDTHAIVQMVRYTLSRYLRPPAAPCRPFRRHGVSVTDAIVQAPLSVGLQWRAKSPLFRKTCGSG